MHGGGWVLGNAGTHDRLVRELAVGAGAAVVFVEYDRSPEARYPVAIEQGYATAQWIVARGRRRRARRDAARRRRRLRRRQHDRRAGADGRTSAATSRFVHQSLYYPVTDAGDGHRLLQRVRRGLLPHGEGDGVVLGRVPARRRAALGAVASPLRASDEQLAGLPPAFVIVDENDVLRDEGEAYAASCARPACAVTTVRYDGTIHDFMMLNPLRDTHATRPPSSRPSPSSAGCCMTTRDARDPC